MCTDHVQMSTTRLFFGFHLAGEHLFRRTIFTLVFLLCLQLQHCVPRWDASTIVDLRWKEAFASVPKERKLPTTQGHA